MNEGTAQPLEGRSLIRFERRYPHSMERVWAALTEPEQLQQWFGEGDIELELVEGGRFDVVTTGPAELVGAMIEFGGGEEALERHDTVLARSIRRGCSSTLSTAASPWSDGSSCPTGTAACCG